MGTADPPWPTPAECYLAELASVTSMSIGAAGGTVELDTAQIVAAPCRLCGIRLHGTGQRTSLATSRKEARDARHDCLA